jgi:hypothetical protein
MRDGLVVSDSDSQSWAAHSEMSESLLRKI